MEINKKDSKKFTENQLYKITEYQKIHTRLKILKFQMSDIQEETHDLIETLDKMRKDDKNKEEDNG